eukprot:2168636-Rhodomonas_salina.1
MLSKVAERQAQSESEHVHALDRDTSRVRIQGWFKGVCAAEVLRLKCGATFSALRPARYPIAAAL